jgi:hypothetical protein
LSGLGASPGTGDSTHAGGASALVGSEAVRDRDIGQDDLLDGLRPGYFLLGRALPDRATRPVSLLEGQGGQADATGVVGWIDRDVDPQDHRTQPVFFAFRMGGDDVLLGDGAGSPLDPLVQQRAQSPGFTVTPREGLLQRDRAGHPHLPLALERIGRGRRVKDRVEAARSGGDVGVPQPAQNLDATTRIPSAEVGRH